MKIDGHTKIIAIFGWPLSYTRSPRFQNAGLELLGLNAAYVPMPVKPGAFAALFKGLAANPQFLGANVTNPHKRAALRLAGRLSPEARAIGAVNTLYRSGKSWVGHNTDAAGFLASLPSSPKGRRVLLLGAGGTARALAYAVLKAGASRLDIGCRRPAQGRALLKAIKASKSKAGVLALAGKRWDDALQNADWVLNTIPDPAWSSELARQIKAAMSLRLAFDASYAKGNPFLAAARARGLKALDGNGMLLEQGCLSFSRWTGKKAPKAAMRRALGH